MTTLTDPCNHLKQQLAAALQAKLRYMLSKPVVYVLLTQSFEYSAVVPQELDELITRLKQEIDDCERSV